MVALAPRTRPQTSILHKEPSWRRVACVTLSTSTKYDVLVVGAGIFGMASAYYIKKSSPEKNVLAIDRFGDVAQGNTGRSNAMYRNMFTSADNRTLTRTDAGNLAQQFRGLMFAGLGQKLGAQVAPQGLQAIQLWSRQLFLPSGTD